MNKTLKTITKLMKIHKIIAVIVSVALIVACSKDNTTSNQYDADSFLQFSDSAYIMPVTETDNGGFKVTVGMTRAANYDRSIAVAIDHKASNAIEGYHFTLESHNVVIPAGQLTADLILHGKYDNINSVDDSLAVTLTILADKGNFSELYGNKTNIRLVKVRPFHIEDYVGDLLMTCTFPFSTSSVTKFYVKSEKIDDYTLLIKKPFDTARDIVIRFNDNHDDPLRQDIFMAEQVAFTDNSYGMVSMTTVDGAPSYYLPEDRAFVLYLNAFLAQVGSFGSFYYIFQWVTPDEALANANGMSTLY